MYMGDYLKDAIVYLMFNTFTSDNPSASSTITNFINTDVHIHKDNDLTQRNNEAGIVVSVNFDGIIGSHMIVIDTSDDTVEGFWVAGSDYFVRIEGTIVGGGTINAVVGHFSIENRFKEVTVTSMAANVLTAAAINADSAIEIAAAVWDRVLTGGTHNVPTSAGRRLRGIQDFQGYENGSIWVDTINGSAGTTDYENGTVENPVDSWADALTLSASLGIKRFTIAGASTITLSANSDTYVLMGSNWTLNLNGQSIVGAHFSGAIVNGVAGGTGTIQVFDNCIMNAISHIKGTYILNSGMAGTQTVIEAGDYFLDKCYSAIAGTSTWIWEFGDAIGNTNLNVRHHSGGIQLESMGDTGTDTVSIEGFGQIIEGTCTGGVVAIRGNFTVSGITNLTLSDGARIDIDNIWDEILTAATHNVPGSAGRRLRDIGSDIVLTGISPDTGGTANTAIRIELDGDASSVDGAYDPAIVVITNGTGMGQARQIFEYDGSNKYAYINRSWKVIPDNTSEYTIVGSSGNMHVNEGLVTGGGNISITLNALASSVDDTYKGQLIFLAAGIGEDQARMITAYNGTTKVATIDRVWETNPVNSETIYAVLPMADITLLALEATVDAIQATIDLTQVDVTEILNYESGDWEIVDDQMIFKIAGGAEIGRFDLTKAGLPDSDAPDKREKV